MKKLAAFLYRFRYGCLVLIAAVTAGSIHLIDIQMDNSIGAWFSPRNPDYLVYRDFCSTYEDGRFIIIGLKAPSVFTPEILRYIARKTTALEEVTLPGEPSPVTPAAPEEADRHPAAPPEDGDLFAMLEETPETSVRLVKRVHSLANANKIIGTEDGISITPLLENLQDISPQLVRRQALEDDLFNGYLVSDDGGFTTMVVAFEDMTVTETDAAVDQVRAIMADGKPDGLETTMSGDIMMMSEFNQFAKQNQTVFPVLIIGIITIFMGILFRSLSRVFIVLTVVGISLCWTLGFNCLLGFSVNVVTGMLIPLVIILSIADCIHIIEYFDEISITGMRDGARICTETVAYITIPCFITSLTTAIGLASLAASPIEAVKNFGIGSAAGIMFAFMISILTVPWLLALSPCAPPAPANGGPVGSAPAPETGSERLPRYRFWDACLRRVARINTRSTTLVLLVTVLGFIVFGLGIGWIRIETNQMDWFPKDSPFFLASGEVDRRLSGAGDLEVLLSGGENDLKDPAILCRMDELCRDLADEELVGKVISLSGYIRRINRALHDGDPRHDTVPASRALIAQELFLFSLSDDGRDELRRLVTADYSRARISVKISIQNTASRKIVALARSMEARAREVFDGTGVTVEVNGISYMYNILYKYLLESQIKSFALAFLLVTGLLFIIFRSPRYGLLSITPNLLPVIFILGLMGWLGISLNVGTVMVASVALGIALDDTIHYLSRYRRELALAGATASLTGLAQRTTVHSGKAIIFTSVINIAGFLVPMLSGFQPTREFGLLVAMTLFFALAADLFVLPSTIIASGRVLIAGQLEREEPDRS